MLVTAIVLAAGRGLRFRSRVSKPLVNIGSQPMLIHCLSVLARHPKVNQIILVVNSENLKQIIRKLKEYRIKKVKKIVLGGRLRQDSVRNGLRVLDPKTDFVLIHDSARPFLDAGNITSLIKKVKKCRAAILGVPVKATIKRVIGRTRVEETLNRDNLWEIQTPQIFQKDLILGAYRKFGNRYATDDASLVERLGVPVEVVRGSSFNLKLTTPEDLMIAEAILKAQN